MVMTRRELAKQKIREGWDKLAAEHPDKDCSASHLLQDLKAEEEIADAIKRYDQGEPLTVVRDAFRTWADMKVREPEPQTLFK